MTRKTVLIERAKYNAANAAVITRLTEREREVERGSVLRVENKWQPTELSNSSKRLTPESTFKQQTAGWQHPTTSCLPLLQPPPPPPFSLRKALKNLTMPNTHPNKISLILYLFSKQHFHTPT